MGFTGLKRTVYMHLAFEEQPCLKMPEMMLKKEYIVKSMKRWMISLK